MLLSSLSSRPFNDSAWGPKTTRRKPLMTNPFISSARTAGKACSQQPVKEGNNVENTDSSLLLLIGPIPRFITAGSVPEGRGGRKAFNLALLASSFWNA